MKIGDKPIFKEGIWVTFGELASAAGALVGIRLLTEYLSPDVYGKVALLMGVVALSYASFCAPFMAALIRFYPDFAKSGCLSDLRASVKMKLFITTGLLVSLLISVEAVYHYYYRGSIMILLLLPCLLVLDVALGIVGSFLTAARRQKPYSLMKLGTSWGRPMFAMLLVILIGSETSKVLLGYFTASALTVAAVYLFVEREGRGQGSSISGRDGEGFSGTIWKYALPLIPLALIGWISGVGDRYVIGAILSFEKVGIYAAAYGLMSRPFILVRNIIIQTLRPVYFSAISEKDEDVEKKILITWIILGGSISLFGVLGFFLFHNLISSLLLGAKYRVSSVLMPWIAIGYAFFVLSNVFEQAFYGYGLTRYVTLIQGVGAASSIIVGIPFIYFLGLKGAAYSVSIYFFLQCVFSIFLYKRKLYSKGKNGKA